MVANDAGSSASVAPVSARPIQTRKTLRKRDAARTTARASAPEPA